MADVKDNAQPNASDPKTTDSKIAFTFKTPEKAVKSMAQMDAWKRSGFYHDVGNFIMTINAKIKGTKKSARHSKSDKIKLILEFLDRIFAMIKDIPPIKQA